MLHFNCLKISQIFFPVLVIELGVPLKFNYQPGECTDIQKSRGTVGAQKESFTTGIPNMLTFYNNHQCICKNIMISCMKLSYFPVCSLYIEYLSQDFPNAVFGVWKSTHIDNIHSLLGTF